MALQSGGTSRDKLAAGTTAQRPALAAGDSGSIRYNSSTGKMEYWDGSAWRILMIDQVIGNGAINVNAGTGISASGSNATANQTGNTTRTIAVDTTWLDNRINGKIGNGQINVNAGTGCVASGSNATANQGGNTTRTISFDVTWGDARYKVSGGGGGSTPQGETHAWVIFGPSGNIMHKYNVARVDKIATGRFKVYYSTASGYSSPVVIVGAENSQIANCGSGSWSGATGGSTSTNSGVVNKGTNGAWYDSEQMHFLSVK